MPPPMHMATIPYLPPTPAEFVDELGRQLGASAAQRVPQGDCAAVDVDLVLRDSGLLYRVHELTREGLIDFEEIDVVDLETGLFQDFGYGQRRPNPHLFGGATRDRKSHEASHGFEPFSPRTLGTHEHHSRRTV